MLASNDMADETGSESQLEIGHVLFMDLVGYSKRLLDEQRELQQELTQIVRGSAQVQAAEAAGKLVRIPTGDGMALVFFNSPEAPVRCAVEIASALKSHPEIEMRMGIHSGPVNELRDVNDRANIAGAGINIAQRVMDCGDAGHILLSKRAADDLAQSRQWRPYLHDLGECEVKHGLPVFVVNLFTDEVGKQEPPAKFKQLASSGKPPAPVWRHPGIALAALALLLLGAGAFWWQRQHARPVISEKSIAVLPFQNFSDDKANAFFADGIQDDILTNLARIRDLRVISRTSVEKYRSSSGQSPNLRDVAKELNVANILEGSVRREGNRVVVNVQLIDARQDRHLWASRYDRTLEDSLGLEGQLAREIAEALQATLTPEEKALVERRPTADAQAYDLYLQARLYDLKPDTFQQDFRTAEQLYMQAIMRDPQFALARAQLAACRARIYHYYEPTEAWKNKARSEADAALRLQPNLAEAHHSLALCYYWFDRDYENALRELAIAQQLSPNDSTIPFHMATIKRRQGKWTEAVEDYRGILVLDPQNANIIRDLLYLFCAMRDWPNARVTAERLLALTPDSINAKTQIGYVEFWETGSTQRLRAELATVPAGQDPDGAVSATRMDVAFIDRDVNTAEQVLRASPLETFSYFNAVDTPRSYFAGVIALLRGDSASAHKEFGQARLFMQHLADESPEAPEPHAFLGLICAYAGDKEKAISEGKRAVELRPESQDALDGAVMNAILALIYARTGETAQAIALLHHLLTTAGSVDAANYSISVNDLKNRWEWDPIRQDPEFQKLIGGK